MATPTTAQTFFGTINVPDQTFTGSNKVEALAEAAPGTANTTTTMTWSSTTASTETVIPLTATTTASDTSNNNGFAFNNTGTDGLNSTSSQLRIVPAGTWTFSGTLTFNAPALLATISATPTVKVYRVATSGGVRSLLFSQAGAAVTATAAGAKAFAITASGQSQIILQPGEVIWIGFTVNSAATANVLNQVTNTVLNFTIGTTGGAEVVVPSPGIRTEYIQPGYLGTGIGVVRSSFFVTKTRILCTGSGTSILHRALNLKRSFTGIGNGITTESPLVIKKVATAIAHGIVLPFDKIVLKPTLAIATGTTVRQVVVVKVGLLVHGIGTGVFNRFWQASREFTPTASVTGSFVKHTIFVRNFIANGVMRIKPRFDIPWSAVPIGGASTVIRKIIQIFDD